MRFTVQILMVTALWLVLCMGGSAQQRPPRIDVTKGPFEAIPMAIVPFELEGQTSPELKKQLHEVLQFDLEFTGYFYLLPNQGQIEELHQADVRSGEINYTAWRSLGADAVIKGSVAQRGPGLIDVDLKIYYTKGSYRIVGKRYSSDPRHFRQLVHRVSDEIVFHLTGATGIAQTRIAFVYETLEKGRSIKELYLIDYDGYPGSLKRLTNDQGLVEMPAWSPDGKEIAFVSYFKKNPDLYSINVQTGQRRMLSGLPGLNNSPTWHPSGKDLVFVASKDGNSELYRLDLVSMQATRITYDRDSIESSPCYSPDGKKLALTSDRGRVLRVYIMDAQGGGLRRISPDSGWYDLPAWSPRGDLIAFVGTQEERRRYDIYTVRPDGSDLNRLTTGPGSNESPSWSPDGRHILFTSNREGNRNLYVINRWGQNLRRITFLPGNCYSPDWSVNPERR